VNFNYLPGQQRMNIPMTTELATRIAKVSELHGRAAEITNRMREDARLIAEVQREMAANLQRLWQLHNETPPADVHSRRSHECSACPMSKGGSASAAHRSGGWSRKRVFLRHAAYRRGRSDGSGARSTTG
jgi:hypothetical protein